MPRIKTIVTGAGRFWNDRKRFTTIGDWLRGVREMAAWHVLKSRLGSTDPAGAIEVRLAGHDLPMRVRRGTSDFEVVRGILVRGEYDAVLPHILGAKLIVDLGANIGASVRRWLLAFAGCHVIAVEPEPQNVAMLRSNLLGADANRVTVIEGAVGAGDGVGHVVNTAGSWGFTVAAGSGGRSEANGDQVKIYSLPTILAMAGVGDDVAIDLLKMDIEGGEAEIFAGEGARQWLGRVKALVIETHAPYLWEDLQRDLQRLGVEFKVVSEKVGPELSEGALIFGGSR